MNAEIDLVGGELRKHQAQGCRREEFQQNGAHAQHRAHDGDGDVEGVLGAGLVIAAKTWRV